MSGLQVHSLECCSVSGVQKAANVVNIASVSQTNGGVLKPEIYSISSGREEADGWRVG